VFLLPITKGPSVAGVPEQIDPIGRGVEIVCHAGEHVASIALSIDGGLLVTASNVGTQVKLIDTKQRTVLRVFTRGMFAANIMCLGISRDCKWVCVASDKTIHVFDLSKEDG